MTSVPFFDETDMTRVLCVVAHPDDMEYGGSAAVARWTAKNIEVSYLLLTAGEAGMRNHQPEEVAPLRTDEQRQACAEVGVESLVVLDFADGTLQNSLETRKAIARRIRQFRPDVVLTQTWDLEVPWGLNHADHRATGLAAVDAIRDADNPWVFPELKESEGLEPWSASWLLVSGTAEPTHLIDVTGKPVESAIRSLQAHRAYLAQLPDLDPTQIVESITSEGAQHCDDAGVTHALGVRAYPM